MIDFKDEFGRKFKTLRISLINTCNLGCIYCTQGTSELTENHALTKADGLPTDRLVEIIQKLHQVLHLETIRFTGGEPLLYKNLPQIVRATRDLNIDQLKITTNGVLLEAMAEELAEAGVKWMNVSLDALDESAFFRISRRKNVSRIIKGIEKAIEMGIDIKLNTVIMKGINEDQILPLLDFAFEKNIKIRFLEIMSMGHLFGQADKHFFSQQEILSVIGSKYSFNRLLRQSSSTANYWQTDSGKVFGVIANESAPFCADCNRLRLDSFGNIYGCLSTNQPISLSGIQDEQGLIEKLQQAMAQKQSLKFTGSNLSMLNIGG